LYNQCCYCVVNIYTRLMQLERIKSELKRRSYEFLKILCVLYKIKYDMNFNVTFMSKQRYYMINNNIIDL
jgi:hypothetical protein